jgi:hypothetical protein
VWGHSQLSLRLILWLISNIHHLCWQHSDLAERDRMLLLTALLAGLR